MTMVHKGFAEVNGKLIHYVRQGSGPAVILLHAAPCSAKVMAPFQLVLAERFTTFAFDLPGFGLSEMPDVPQVETHHLADAIAGAVRALGLTQVAAYGRHTGAGVAVELAHRHPALCSMVLTDGFPVFASPYTPERLSEYLLPIEPRWDGSHLTWTWFRYREQHIFWPWDRPLAAHRSDCDVPDLDFLYRGTIEMLESGENYPKIYASAFRHAGLAMIDAVKPPVCYGNRPGDSQHKTMRLYPPTAWVQEFPRDAAEAAVLERDILALHPASIPTPHQRGFQPGAARVTDYVQTSFGPAYTIGAGLDRKATPVLILHDLPGAAGLHLEQIEAIGADRPVIAFDFAGHCNSVPGEGQRAGIDTWVAQIREVMAALGFDAAHIYAHGTAAAIAIELASAAPACVASLVLHAPPALEQSLADQLAPNYAPDITPSRDGGNFLRLWHHLRDQELWWPWFDQRRGNARPAPRIAPDRLHARAVALLKQPAQYRPTWRELLSYPLERKLRHLTVPTLLVYRDADQFAFARDHAAELLATKPLHLPETEAEAASRLAPWFDGLALNTDQDAATAPPAPATLPAGRAHDRD